MSCHQNAGQKLNVRINKKAFVKVMQQGANPWKMH